MVAVVVIYPEWNHLQYGRGVWSELDPGVVALECFDEGLADAVALGASHRSEAGNQTECCGELQSPARCKRNRYQQAIEQDAPPVRR